jgi:N-acyl amino acid synthase of PEP-CTERM/exosortase system
MPIAPAFDAFWRIDQKKSAENSAAVLFNRYLSVVRANTDDLLDQVYRLRFQVYCIERGFEDPAQYPNGREMDPDDPRSLHFLVLERATGTAAATVRLILPQGDDLPVFRLTEMSPTRISAPSRRTAEVSRFAVTKALRRPLETGWFAGAGHRTALSILTLGLIRAVLMMSSIAGITHLVALMEPSLLRLLRRAGIGFNPIGNLVEHHGVRQPSWAALTKLSESVWLYDRKLWEIATDGGHRLRDPHLAVAEWR